MMTNVFYIVSIFSCCLGVIVAARVKKSSDEGCTIKLNGDLPPKNQPLYLKKSGSTYEMITPAVNNRDGFIELKKNEKITLACPGRNNYLALTRTTISDSTCVKSTTINVDNAKSVNTKEASCAKPVQAEVKVTKTRCAQIGKIYEIGFQAQGWHQMISVCHDTSTSNSLYVTHVLKGTAISGAEKESNRPTFNVGDLNELYSGFDPDNFYKKRNQEAMFENTLGKRQSKKYFSSSSNDFFLSRGHLAPDGDFIFGSEQFASYFYINAAPEWQVINAGNWLTIEKMVRKYANKTQNDITVVTGTYGILELEDDNGKLQKMYLNYQKKSIPVPKYFWKIVYNPSNSDGIAIVTLNNPYESVSKKIPFCSTPCEDYSWTWPNSKKEFVNATLGITNCCSVSDLRKQISHTPFLNVKNVLRGNYFNKY